MGDNVPDVNIIEPTPILENSSIATPGLKHHQLSVLDALPAHQIMDVNSHSLKECVCVCVNN